MAGYGLWRAVSGSSPTCPGASFLSQVVPPLVLGLVCTSGLPGPALGAPERSAMNSKVCRCPMGGRGSF